MRTSLLVSFLLASASLTAIPASATIINVTLTGNNENITDNNNVFGLGAGTISGQAFVQRFAVNTAAMGFGGGSTSTSVSSNSIFDPNPPFAVSGSLTINGHTFSTLGSSFSSIFTGADYQISSTDPQTNGGPGSSFSIDLSGAGLPNTVSQPVELDLTSLVFKSDSFEDETSNGGVYDAIGSLDPSHLSVSSEAISAVPETATWVMMLLGFGALGFSAYKKSQVAKSATMKPA